MDYHKEYQAWLGYPQLAEEERAELIALDRDEEALLERFGVPMTFGTAGIRGKVGLGTGRMNVYTIRHATQALADVLFAKGARRVCVGYDGRHDSARFAREAAQVFAARGLSVFLFAELRPTPLCSFAIRHFGLDGGVCVTASHNRAEYNGVKVFNRFGAQITAEEAEAVSRARQKLGLFETNSLPLAEAERQGLITWLGEEVDRLFIAAALKLAGDGEETANGFRAVYTPLHGTGGLIMPQLFTRIGADVVYEDRQMRPDGDFPTVQDPNPEYPKAFRLAQESAERVGAQMIIANDPDGDRTALMARDGSGQFRWLSGHQTGVLLIDYLIERYRRAGALPPGAVLIKTIVTTDMARAVAEAGGVECVETFTGFKHMSAKVQELGRPCLLAFEEACGFMTGEHVCDKDGMTAAMLLYELGRAYHSQGWTVFDRLEELYRLHGHYVESAVNLPVGGVDFLEKMRRGMEELRANPPRSIGPFAVTETTDYLSGVRTGPGGAATEIPLKGEDVLCFLLEGGGKVFVRPSGTEPKIKVYILARGESREEAERQAKAAEAWAGSELASVIEG